MIPIRGLVVSVNYGDLLRLTLIRNMRHLVECVVVSSPADRETAQVVADVPGARLYLSDVYQRYGAKFNKGALIEEGMTALGREGWLLLWDADIILPDRLEFFQHMDHETLYNAPRRILEDPNRWHPGLSFSEGYETPDPGHPGYFQLFHAGANHLRKRPWYNTTYSHAGGSDSRFEELFSKKIKLPFEVLHLGPRDTNWHGRISKRVGT